MADPASPEFLGAGAARPRAVWSSSIAEFAIAKCTLPLATTAPFLWRGLDYNVVVESGKIESSAFGGLMRPLWTFHCRATAIPIAAALLLTAITFSSSVASEGARLFRQRNAVGAVQSTRGEAIPLSVPDDAYWSDRFGTPGPGWVNAMTTYQGDLIVGGYFEYCDGQPAGGISRWDGTTWHALGGGVRPASVSALCIYQEELIVGGGFDVVDGTPAGGVARWNGATWSSMGTLTDVYDLQEHGGVLHAASANGAYSWNGSGWTLLLNGYFYDLLVFDTQLVAIGFFDIAGTPAEVAAWNGVSWTILANETDLWANRGVVYQGELYVGGEFDTIDGISVHGLARWTGSTWESVSPGSGPNTVFDLQVHDDRLVVLGALSAVPGQPAGRVATWDGVNWDMLGDFASGGGGALCGWSWNGALHVGGSFRIAGSKAVWGLTRWSGSDWVTVGPLTQRGVNGAIQEFTQWNSQVVAMGTFTAAGDAVCLDGLATFDGADWSPLPMPPGSLGSVFARLYALGTWQGDLVVGGRFTQFAGQSINGVVAWNGSAWQGFGDGLNAEPLTFATYEGDLVAAGCFTASGAQPLARVARWNGTAWQPMGGGFNDDVRTLRVHGGQLFAGGAFTASGANPVSYLAVWDGAAWQPVGGGVNGGVNALEDYAGELIAAGAFTTAGGQPASRIARWNGLNWSPLGAGFNLSIVCLQSYGGELYAARQGNPFLTAQPAAESAAIARWNGSSWSTLGSGMTAGNVYPFGPRIYAMAVHAGHLYLGGDFAGAGYKPAAYVTRWELPGPSGVAETPRPVRVSLAAWPNPARGPVTLRVELPQPGPITLEIVDVQGRRVRRLVTMSLPPGTHLLTWDGRDDAGREAAPGVYFARLATGAGSSSTRVIRVRSG